MNPLMLQIDEELINDVTAIKGADGRLRTLSDYVVAGMYEEWCQKFYQQSWVKPGDRRLQLFVLWAFSSPFVLYGGK